MSPKRRFPLHEGGVLNAFRLFQISECKRSLGFASATEGSGVGAGFGAGAGAGLAATTGFGAGADFGGGAGLAATTGLGVANVMI